MNPSASTQPEVAHDAGSDLLLVGQALAGDRDAVDRLLGRLSCTARFVFRMNHALHIGLPTEALEDVVQQVYTTVWTRLESYSGAASLESWAFGFCRNCLRAELRRRSKRLHLLRSASEHLAQTETPNSQPEIDLMQHEGLDLLQEELAKLSPEERTVVELRHLEDWSFERISRHLQMPASTIKDRCYRALQKLRGALRRRDVSV